MARITFVDFYDDEHMYVDGHHHMGRYYRRREFWIYWDTHINSHVAEPVLLITDDFGSLVTRGSNHG